VGRSADEDLGELRLEVDILGDVGEGTTFPPKKEGTFKFFLFPKPYLTCKVCLHPSH
jgi:hypothetical protein